MRIKQLYSAFGSHFKVPMMKKYGMIPYTNPNEPVLMFGCYGNQIEVALKNKSKVKIAFAGSDAWHFIHNQEYIKKVKEKDNIEFIAISKFIENDLKSIDIPCKNIPIVPMDNSDIKPYTLGDSIYIYKPKTYGPHLYRQIQKELPQFNYIETNLHSYSRQQLLEIYKQCFIGLRFINHDGMSNTVIEMGLMGRKMIYNGGTPNAISYDSKNINEILENILTEFDNKKTNNYMQISKQVHKFIDIGDDFLNI